MKKGDKNQTNPVLLAIIVGVLAGGITAYAVVNYNLSQPKTQEELIKEFYEVETATHISPHGLRKHMGEDDSHILVDLRSREEYEEEHITTAVNVPAYKDRDHSDYGAVDRIVKSFKKLKEENPDKDFIVYCYSAPCMTGRKIGKILADNGIYVKHLGVGWNEWKYDWKSFNHPHEWATTSSDQYISSGPEPGVLSEDLTGIGCPIGSDELGC
ncbi:MAG: rhodanese-like domain-containing protein [Candidatus Woesearchaeota archaeon]|jgi:rhodanese-related sulfurtransferase|nr:rhodanese-like domain-containing protein [Candidatus Woesearchaeota archaeon]|tara:strand:- start:3975 stop:4613 length:639 start_codon:yes stop_codon:yes gene_type:complete